MSGGKGPQPAARAGDHTKCPEDGFFSAPHVGGPLSNAVTICMEADGKRLVRLGDYAACEHAPQDVVVEGAATFTVCGLPVARFHDGTIHEGEIIEGSIHFIVGGPTFRAPKNITIEGSAYFQNAAIRDLYALSTTRSGRILLDRLAKSNKPILLREAETVDEDSTSANGFFRAQRHVPTGSTVLYDPDHGINAYDNAGGLISDPPTMALGHELIHAMHIAEGKWTGGVDPACVSEPTIPGEESVTIGTGSHTTAVPSENSLRDDLKLPRRANHGGQYVTVFGPRPLDELRPGDCRE